MALFSPGQLSVPDRQPHSKLITGDEGANALQSQGKLVTRVGGTAAASDFDISGYDLTADDYTSGITDIGGASGVSLAIESQQSNEFHAKVELYDEDENLLQTIDDAEFSVLRDNQIATTIPVFSDKIQVLVTDTSGAPDNTIDGSVNVNSGMPSVLTADITSGTVTIQGSSGNEFEDAALDSSIAVDSTSIVTYPSRALRDQGQDYMETVLYAEDTNSNPAALNVTAGGALETSATLSASDVGLLNTSENEIDPATEGSLTSTLARDVAQIGGQSQSAVDVAQKIDDIEDALGSVGTDHLLIQENSALDVSGATVTVSDDGGFTVTDDGSFNVAGTVSVQESTALDVSGATVDVQEATALDVSAATVPTEQQTPVGVEDSSGTQVDPDEAPDYPDNVTTGHDLIGSGDLTVGPVPVNKAQAILVAANSTDNNNWSASATWTDGSGNTIQNETNSELGLNNVDDTSSRLIRKGRQVSITFTDESGGAQNNINAFIGTHR